MNPSLDAALEEERRHAAERVTTIRALASVMYLLPSLRQWEVGEAVAQTRFPLFAFYAAASAVLAIAVRRSPAVGGSAWWAIPLLDVPVSLLAVGATLGISETPQADAVLAVMNLMLLLIVSQLSMRPLAVAVTGAVGVLGLVLLLPRLGYPYGFAHVAFVVALGAVSIGYVPDRLVSLVTRAVEERSRREQLGRYFSPQVAERIVAETGGVLPGERRVVTVLFSDIRGFTAMSETMDPAAVVALLGEYHQRMVTAIFETGGTLDKFIGDGIMAWFGAPLPSDDHAARAVTCALRMETELAALNVLREARGEAALKIGVGLHTGEAIVGTIGSPERREFTAIGDAVNTASRIEGLTKSLGVTILCSAATCAQAGESFAWTAAPLVEVKGKTEPLATFVPRFR
ncbi:MAG: adenylate/guanylate cyclase domain-containing protein [Myxococcales bacterium]